MNHNIKGWKATHQHRLLTKQNETEWVETFNGKQIDRYKFIESKKNEIYLYNNQLKIYYKLTSKSISYGASLNGKFKYLYEGTWVHNEQATRASTQAESSAIVPKNNKSKIKLNQAFSKMVESKKTTLRLFELISNSEIISETFESPFGNKKIIYVDYTASGRSLNFIEDIIKETVLPNYSNTHSDCNYTAEKISNYRREARNTIRKSVNASDQLDSLVFVGSGSTAAVSKLIGLLNITEPPLVIISPYEHHSNLLPWREIGSEIIWSNDAVNASIDLVDLENKLKLFQNERRLKIGSFTAASNITGTILDVNKIAKLLHKYGFLSFWDYSTAAPHIKIDMNPKNDEQAYKDAVFFSGHKFIGGPQTPGVLIAKNNLFKNQIPTTVGGGTVFAVTKEKHIYINNNEEREEGGTPAIIESIRLGLVFQLKNSLNFQIVEQREFYYTKKGMEFFKKIPNIVILGNLELKRLPIFSFLIRHEQTGLFLHHNFVTKFLNDLFGIQSRSGCSCAGPYAEYLLGINEELAEKFIFSLSHKNDASPRKDWESSHTEILKPGFTRINLPFFFSESRVDYVLNAIKFVCEHGWKFLPQYKFCIESGRFTHVLRDSNEIKHSLIIDSYLDKHSDNTKVVVNKAHEKEETILYKTQLEAYKFLKSLQLVYGQIKGDLKDDKESFKKYKEIKWFLLPIEAFEIYQKLIIEKSNAPIAKLQAPFKPITNFGKFDNATTKYKDKNCALCQHRVEKSEKIEKSEKTKVIVIKV